MELTDSNNLPRERERESRTRILSSNYRTRGRHCRLQQGGCRGAPRLLCSDGRPTLLPSRLRRLQVRRASPFSPRALLGTGSSCRATSLEVVRSSAPPGGSVAPCPWAVWRPVSSLSQDLTHRRLFLPGCEIRHQPPPWWQARSRHESPW